MIASASVALLNSLLAPFFGGPTTEFARHLLKVTKMSVYAQSDAIPYVTPLQMQLLENGALKINSNLFDTRQFRRTSKLPETPPGAPTPPGLGTAQSPYILIVRPRMYSRHSTFPGLIGERIDTTKPKPIQPDSFRMFSQQGLWNVFGELSLERINDLGLSVKVEIPSFFQKMKVTIFDNFCSEEDLLECTAQAIGCRLRKDNKVVYFEPIGSEVRTRIVKSIQFYDQQDGSNLSRQENIRLKVIDLLSDSEVENLLSENSKLKEIVPSSIKGLEDECRAIIKSKYANLLKTADPETVKRFEPLKDFKKIKVRVGFGLHVSISAVDNEGLEYGF